MTTCLKVCVNLCCLLRFSWISSCCFPEASSPGSAPGTSGGRGPPCIHIILKRRRLSRGRRIISDERRSAFVAPLAPAPGHYPQFIVVTRPSLLQGKLREKEKQTKRGRKQITRQETLHKLINKQINKQTNKQKHMSCSQWHQLRIEH